MSTAIYRSLWIFLTLVATIYDKLRWLAVLLQALYKKSCDFFDSSPLNEIEYLEQCKHELQKIPKHMTIIVGPTDNTSADALSRIAVYALIMDIDCISFYDTRPSTKFTLERVQIPKYVSSRKIQNGRFLWSMPGGSKSSGQLKYKNGLEKSIEVVMIDAKDGRPLIAEVCRELHTQRDNKMVQELLKDRTRLSEKITELLARKLNNLPDPELGVIFNKYTCTFGLLPWHTRFTEFHTFESGRYFNVEAFANVLYKFSRCEQRFGK